MKSSRRQESFVPAPTQEEVDQARKVVPFMESGEIFTPAHEFDFKIVTDAKIPIVRFPNDQKLFASLSYKGMAPALVYSLFRIDIENILKHAPSVEEGQRIVNLIDIGLCLAVIRQIQSTLDHDLKLKFEPIVQRLSAEIRFPKFVNDFVRLIGQRRIPYGWLKFRDPAQVLVDFMAHALKKVVYDQQLCRDLEDSCFDEYKVPKHLAAALRRLQMNSHAITNDRFSLEAGREIAIDLWNSEAAGETLTLRGDGTEFMLKLLTYEEMLKLNPGSAEMLEFIRDLIKRVDAKKAARLMGIVTVINPGAGFAAAPNPNYHGDCPELINLTVPVPNVGDSYVDFEMLVEALIRFFPLFESRAQPLLDRLYKTEPFRPTAQGHPCQMVVNNRKKHSITSIVNLSRYPLMLGTIFDLTDTIKRERVEYSTSTDVNREYASVFVQRDERFLTG